MPSRTAVVGKGHHRDVSSPKHVGKEQRDSAAHPLSGFHLVLGPDIWQSLCRCLQREGQC